MRVAAHRPGSPDPFSYYPAIVASAFATLHHVSGGRAHLGVSRGDTALELVERPPSGPRRLQPYQRPLADDLPRKLYQRTARVQRLIKAPETDAPALKSSY
jgi:alkanesulfonate monooxygenase SsuD/methylene tetrahydromethanopterin reductase-like flavin-dependent oxidoreductase (luciferase family)